MQRPRAYPRSLVRVYGELAEHAQAAEDMGFDAIWVTEHHFWYDGYCPALLPVLGYLARRTNRIKLGTGILLLPLHDPLQVAEGAAVIDHLSGGRVVLGFGLGYRPEEFHGFGIEKRTRGSRLAEAVEVVKLALTQERVDYRGRYFTYEEVPLSVPPFQKPHPPLWLGAGMAKRTTERAAQLGLHCMEGSHIDLDVVAEFIRTFREAEARARLPYRLQIALMRNICIAETETEAWQIFEEDLVPQYEDQYVGFGMLLDQAGSPLRDLDRHHPTFQAITRNAIVGTPDQVIDRLKQILQRFKLDALVFKTQFSNSRVDRVLRSIRLLGEHVLPALPG